MFVIFFCLLQFLYISLFFSLPFFGGDTVPGMRLLTKMPCIIFIEIDKMRFCGSAYVRIGDQMRTGQPNETNLLLIVPPQLRKTLSNSVKPNPLFHQIESLFVCVTNIKRSSFVHTIIVHHINLDFYLSVSIFGQVKRLL